MYKFAVEFGISFAFTIMMYVRNIYVKKGERPIKGAFATTLLSCLFHIGFVMVMSMVRYVYYDIRSANVICYVVMGLSMLIMPLLSVFIISKIAGCNGSIGITFAVFLPVLVMSVALSYIVASTEWAIAFDPENVYIQMESVEKGEERRELTILDTVRDIISFIPVLTYAVSVFFQKKDNTKKR